MSDELDEKTAFLQNAARVAAGVKSPRLKGHLRRGQAIVDEIPHVAQMGRDAFSTVKGLTSAALAPAATLGPKIMDGVGSLASPRLAKAAIGTAAVAPILMGAHASRQHTNEGDLMSAYQDPSRTITASLEDFLEKKASMAPRGSGAPTQPVPRMSTAIQTAARDSFVDGVGKGVGGGIGSGIGQGITDALFGAIKALAGAAYKSTVTEPKRKALFESILRQDQVIKDALEHHPDGLRFISEAYETMVRVAPTLAMDVNAVRSFLREAIISGAGVNYATIKTLAETERAINNTRAG